MLQTNSKSSPSSRTIRSNSLNVPDGAVALSIQIPSKGTLRKSSICSCSRCSFASETERPRSGMTESTAYSDVDSIYKFPQSRPQSECNLNLIASSPSATKRSASADHFQRTNSGEYSIPPTPPSDTQSRNSSRTSISISTRPSIDNTTGQIKIKLHYNLEMGSLDVGVIECRDLPHFGKHYPNAIIYVSLLPDDGYLEHSRVKTKCKKNSHCPIFGEILKFSNLTKFELDDRTLHFQVFHIDPFTKKSLIGETQIKIKDYPWSEGEPIWLPLKRELILNVPRPESAPQEINSRRGFLRFEMSFKVKDPKKQRGDIHFLAKNGNNLTGDPPVLSKMPFVKANLLSNRKIISSARSSLAEFHGNGMEPIWNYTIIIQDQSLEKLKKRALEISVWDRENSSNNRYIGRLLFYLSSDPKKPEKTMQSLWRRLIETPGAKFVTEMQLQP